MNILEKVKSILVAKKKLKKEEEETIKPVKISDIGDFRKGEPIPVPKDPTLQNK